MPPPHPTDPPARRGTGSQTGGVTGRSTGPYRGGMADPTADPHVPQDAAKLPHGSMPLLGFGTWQIRGEEAADATVVALEAGYRHLDTATVYGNEAEVGRGLERSGVPREDVFVTTK